MEPSGAHVGSRSAGTEGREVPEQSEGPLKCPGSTLGAWDGSAIGSARGTLFPSAES